jgi:hypothetical protein
MAFTILIGYDTIAYDGIVQHTFGWTESVEASFQAQLKV